MLEKNEIVTGFTVGDRSYEMIPICRDGEKHVTFGTIRMRAREIQVSLGDDDGRYLLDKQHLIPVLKDKPIFVFTEWFGHEVSIGGIACISEHAGRWNVYFNRNRDNVWNNQHYFLRRKK